MNPSTPPPQDSPFWPFNLRATPAAPPQKWPNWLHASDLQGLAQLATQASLGISTVAEAVQGQVYKMAAAPLGFVGARLVDQTPGSTGIRPRSLTALAYATARTATRLAGGTANSLLWRLSQKTAGRLSSPPREAMLAAVNALLGDHLLETANPLAITMSLRQDGETVRLNREALDARFPQAGTRLLVLVHGLGMNDLQWTSAGPDGLHDHARMLEREGGYTAIRVHYNSGLHPAVNGAQLAGLLDRLCLAWPCAVDDITVLAHGAGGLVARSACLQGALAEQSWRRVLRRMVFLGTPHRGVPADALDGWMHQLLAAGVVTWPLAQLGQVRSAGMQAFQRGDVLGEPAAVQATALAGSGRAVPPPLPPDVACFTVAAATGPEPRDEPSSARLRMGDGLLGDGLVPLASALGVQPDGAGDLHFAADRRLTVWQTHHAGLLHSAGVASALRGWLA